MADLNWLCILPAFKEEMAHSYANRCHPAKKAVPEDLLMNEVSSCRDRRRGSGQRLL